MARAFILVMDGVGIGAGPDAARFGDAGANTLGHVVEACERGDGDKAGLRSGNLCIPHLAALGLGAALEVASGLTRPYLQPEGPVQGLYGACAEQSFGKDTPSGHWEMAGVPVRYEWGYFPPEYPSFPAELIADFLRETGLPGILANCHASGTVVINELGEEHVASGKPIVYTSADSVMQIAAHEESFGLDRLYEICDVARRLVDAYEIGRVIARPFIGTGNGSYVRTGNRRDIATPPPGPTLLDHLKANGREVISIGKIADIFAHQGLTQKIKATGNKALFAATIDAAKVAPEGALVFTNFVDFDQEYGHRRDVPGFAAALEAFDGTLDEFRAVLRPGDLAILTADHGCDPTAPGTDHTREYVPMVAFGPGLKGGAVGRREGFADIGQSVAAHLGIDPLDEGVSFL